MSNIFAAWREIFRRSDPAAEAQQTIRRLEELQERYGAVMVRWPDAPREGRGVEIVVPLPDGRERHAIGPTLPAAVSHAYMAYEVDELKRSLAVIRERMEQESTDPDAPPEPPPGAK